MGSAARTSFGYAVRLWGTSGFGSTTLCYERGWPNLERPILAAPGFRGVSTTSTTMTPAQLLETLRSTDESSGVLEAWLAESDAPEGWWPTDDRGAFVDALVAKGVADHRLVDDRDDPFFGDDERTHMSAAAYVAALRVEEVEGRVRVPPEPSKLRREPMAHEEHEETESHRAARIHLEERVAALGRELGRTMPEGVGFALLMFDFGEGGSMGYASNAQREDMIEALHEMIAKLGGSVS